MPPFSLMEWRNRQKEYSTSGIRLESEYQAWILTTQLKCLVSVQFLNSLTVLQHFISVECSLLLSSFVRCQCLRSGNCYDCRPVKCELYLCSCFVPWSLLLCAMCEDCLRYSCDKRKFDNSCQILSLYDMQTRNYLYTLYCPPVEAGCNTSIIALGVVEGDEKGTRYLGV
jgi:hypothetical protein